MAVDDYDAEEDIFLDEQEAWRRHCALRDAEYKQAVAVRRAELAGRGLDTYTTDELEQAFEVTWFSYGVCGAIRKADRVEGSLCFDHSPRLYYQFIQKGR